MDTENYPGKIIMKDGPDQLVEYPPHYTSGKMETWDWMELGLSDDEFRGYLKGNVFKYITRYRKKGGVQDLDKAVAYIRRLSRFEETLTMSEEPVSLQHKKQRKKQRHAQIQLNLHFTNRFDE